jgi:hypothetical protein
MKFKFPLPENYQEKAESFVLFLIFVIFNGQKKYTFVGSFIATPNFISLLLIISYYYQMGGYLQIFAPFPCYEFKLYTKIILRKI